jgi:hypothetical protein
MTINLDTMTNTLSKLYLEALRGNDLISIEDAALFFNTMKELKATQSTQLPKHRFVLAGKADWKQESTYFKANITNIDQFTSNLVSTHNLAIESESIELHTETVEEFLKRGGQKVVLDYVSGAETQQVFSNQQGHYSLGEGELFFSEKSKDRLTHKFNLDVIDRDLILELEEAGITLEGSKKRGRKFNV